MFMGCVVFLLDLVFMMIYDFVGLWMKKVVNYMLLCSVWFGGDVSFEVLVINLRCEGVFVFKFVVGVVMYGCGFDGVKVDGCYVNLWFNEDGLVFFKDIGVLIGMKVCYDKCM